MDFEMYERYVLTSTNFIDESDLSFIPNDNIKDEIQKERCNKLFRSYLDSADYELKEMLKKKSLMERNSKSG